MSITPVATELSFADLVRSANAFVGAAEPVDARTVRFWRSEGLVSPPVGAGRGARWGWRHVLEIAYIRRRQNDGAKLSDLRDVVDADVERLAGAVEAPTSAPEGWQPPETESPAAFWDQPIGAIAAFRSEPTATAARPATYAAARRINRPAIGSRVHSEEIPPVTAVWPPRVLLELDGAVAVAVPTHIANNPAAMAALTPSLDALSRAVADLTEQPS